MLTNIFVFVFGLKVDPEYIRIRIHVKKNIPNIFVFVFGPQNNIRYALSAKTRLSKNVQNHFLRCFRSQEISKPKVGTFLNHPVFK